MQFCKTSSVFELNLTTSKREHFCETSFKNGKLSADLMASYQRVLRFPEKKSATKSYDRLQLPPKNHLMLQNATSLRKSAPWPLDMSDGGVSCIAPAGDIHLCRSSSNIPHLPSATKPTPLAHFWPRYRIPGTRKNGLNVQHCSERGALKSLVLWTCSHRNVLCPTTACICSIL